MSLHELLEGQANPSVLQTQAMHMASGDYALLEALIARREEMGLTQADLAHKIGVSQQAISKFERMDADPRLSTIRRYALAVGLKISHDVRPVRKANFKP
jgi:transcriptional regulator with XRE-family HTH domain